jgi:hypothetical protein
MFYKRICKGLNDIGTLIPFNESATIDGEHDFYESIYYYTEEQKAEAEKIIEVAREGKTYNRQQGVAGIEDVATDKIVFDFDHHENLDAARKDTLALTQLLDKRGISPYYVYFSGNKGFSVEIKTDQRITPFEFRNIVTNLAGHLETFDPRIHNASRVFRLPSTKHPVSGLYKTNISLEELKKASIDDIKEIAKEQYELVEHDICSSKNFPKASPPKVKVEPSTSSSTDFDFTDRPTWLSPWKYALSRGLFKEGMRSNALIILAATAKANNMSKVQAYYFCKSAADEQVSRYGGSKFPKEEIWQNIIEQVYGSNWKGGAFSEDNFPENIKDFFKQEGIPRLSEIKNTGEMEIIRVGDISKGFIKFAQEDEKNTIKTGFRLLDESFPIKAGMGVGVIGSPGAGKTSILLQIAEQTSREGVPCVIASIDMVRNRMFHKLVMKETGLKQQEAIELFKKDSKEREGVINKIKEKYKNVWFYDRSFATIAEIREYIERVEDATGDKVKLVMLDYFERLNVDVNDDTAASKKIAGQIQDMVNDMNVACVTFVQPNKFSLSGGPDTPIRNYTAIKGSSFLYQSFRGILSLWRPFYNPQWSEHDHYMQMAILKNDLGELKEFDYGWNGKRGEIYELEDIQRQELKELLQMKEEEVGDKKGKHDI